MPEWSTYSLQDFLMFSPRIYWRLVESHLRQTWPVALLAQAVGVGVLVLSALRGATAARMVAALLALAWAWVAWAFLWERLAEIHWVAQYFAAAFALQALGLLALAAWPGRPAPVGRLASWTGWTLAVAGVLLYPLAGWAAGRPWSQAELWGMAPDPTALATAGLLLAGRTAGAGPRRAALAIIPLLALVVGAATHWAMALSR